MEPHSGSQRPTGRVILTLPYRRPPKPLTGNARTHWSQRSAATKRLRTDVALLARQAGLRGPYTHLWVTLHWAPGDRRRRDADNAFPMLKTICDGLARGRGDWTGLQLVPDDTPEWMTKYTPVIDPPPAPAGMWVVIDYTEEGPR